MTVDNVILKSIDCQYPQIAMNRSRAECSYDFGEGGAEQNGQKCNLSQFQGDIALNTKGRSGAKKIREKKLCGCLFQWG